MRDAPFTRDSSLVTSMSVRIFIASLSLLLFYSFNLLHRYMNALPVHLPVLALVGVVLSVVCSLVISSRRPGPWATSALVFLMLFMCWAPCVQLATGNFPGTAQAPPVELTGMGVLLVTVGIASWLIGYFGTTFSTVERGLDDPAVLEGNRLRLVALAAVAVLAAYVMSVGVGPLLSSRRDLDASLEGLGSARFVVAILRTWAVVPGALVLGARLLWRRSIRGAGRGIYWILGLLLAVAVNPISSPRIFFGFVWGGVALSYAVSRGVSSVRHYLIAFSASMLFLFPVADYFRNDNRSTIGLDVFGAAFEKGDYDAFLQLLNALALTRERGFGWGQQLAGAVMFFVPRSLWAGKPKDSAVLISEFRGYRMTNVSAPLPAEGWLDFGLFGVVVYMICFGLLCRRFDLMICSETEYRRVSGQMLTATFGAPYCLILLRGSLLQSVSVLTAVIVCGWLVVRACRGAGNP